MQATSLPFIVAATAIGRELDLIDAAGSAALIGAGLLSVVLFPLGGLSCCGAARRPAVPRPAMRVMTEMTFGPRSESSATTRAALASRAER